MSIALHWWPFPPPEEELSRICDVDVLRHWPSDTVSVAGEQRVPAANTVLERQAVDERQEDLPVDP